MKNYTSESCHEIGYKWTISAPDALSAEDVEALQKALCEWTDEPDTGELHRMLSDIDCTQLDVDKLPLYRQVLIDVRSVHRETFTQSFTEV